MYSPVYGIYMVMYSTGYKRNIIKDMNKYLVEIFNVTLLILSKEVSRVTN